MTSLHDELEKKLQDSNATPMFLPLQFIKDITCDFSTESELGRGGFGVVYKGVLPSGKIIAVKKLFEIHLVDDKTFQNEVNSLMEIKHQHVVQFVGYCAESSWETIKQPSGNFIWAEIPKRLLCFEYLCNQSLDKYISVPTDESSVLEWNMRYEIIKGICNGLNFLHEKCCMVHLDLKPENIMMDATMMPKIADFGLSRIFGNQQSRIITNNSVGSRGYMAPEYLIQGIISTKADIFSLGVIMIEIITGRRDYPFQLDSSESTTTSCQHFTEEVLGSWRYKFESTAKYISMEKYNQQIEQCITIALKCVDPAMEKRPTANDVIQVLSSVDQMEASKELPSEMQCKDKLLILDTNVSKELVLHSITEDMSNFKTGGTVGDVKKSVECLLPTPLWTSSTGSRNLQEAAGKSSESQQESNKTTEVIAGSSVILDVNPLELLFRFKRDMRIPCSLYLTNNTDKDVAFGLMEKKSSDQKCFISSLPIYAIVAPRTTYALVVRTNKFSHLPKEGNIDLILQNGIVDSSYLGGVDKYFQNVEALGNAVHEVILKAVCAPQRGKTIEQSVPKLMKIISMEDTTSMAGRCLLSMDVNQTEPLIITCQSKGGIRMWNYDTQEDMSCIELSKGTARCIKFIARKEWFLFGSHDGSIHVYKYKNKMKKVTSFKHHMGSVVTSLAVHPTHPYVLVACQSHIQLWDWDQSWFSWKCIQTFEGHSEDVYEVAFNPEDTNSFASVSADRTIKVWSLDSPGSKYTLLGHSEAVHCLDFFTRDGQLYLITGSQDRTAKIWDLRQKACVRTLNARSPVTAVSYHPNLRVPLVGTVDGVVHLWSSTNFRESILDIRHGQWVRGFACLMKSRRVVIGHDRGVSVVEIRHEEVASWDNNENSTSGTD